MHPHSSGRASGLAPLMGDRVSVCTVREENFFSKNEEYSRVTANGRENNRKEGCALPLDKYSGMYELPFISYFTIHSAIREDPVISRAAKSIETQSAESGVE